MGTTQHESDVDGTPTVFAYAKLNIRIGPLLRGEQFEDPLSEALEQNGLGQVTGGGTMMQQNREIDYCGIDLDLVHPETSVPFVCSFLTDRGAPRGSALQYTDSTKVQVETPFGALEGLGLYLTSTDVPALKALRDTLGQSLHGHGAMLGAWQGETETAFYIYGRSSDELRGLIAELVREHPLGQGSRIETIA